MFELYMQKKENSNDIFEVHLIGENLVSEQNQLNRQLYDQSRFGEVKDNKLRYSLVEALYLLEKNRIVIKDSKNKPIDFDTFVKKAVKKEPNFWVRYVVFRDIRSRGYIIKTALKFGADFRVYDRGIKPGQDHAKWILYPVKETDVLTWFDFSAKNRVAHSTKKSLLLACVDDEDDVTYWNVAWIRP